MEPTSTLHPTLLQLEHMVIDALRPYYKHWNVMAPALGISVSTLDRLRKSGKIDKRLGKKADPNPPPLNLRAILFNGLGLA